VRLAIVQTSPIFGNIPSNVRQALDLMATAQADLFVLPELFSTGYNFLDAKETASLAEEASGTSGMAIAAFAKSRKCHVVYGFAERADRIYNSSALVGPDGLIAVYRKVHLFAKETELFAPGNLGFPVFDLPFGRLGMMICFDWMFPESARTLALRGAQIIAHPSNLVMPYCPDAMVTRCLENRVFAATANRIGTEDRGGLNLRYIGNSEIVTPRGDILLRLGAAEVKVGVCDIDPALAGTKSINPYNDLFKDRRPDQYTV